VARSGGAAVTAKAKRRTRKPPRSLSAAEIAKIDELIKARHEQVAWEGQEIFHQAERERQILLREDHTVGPWPERLELRGSTSDGDYVHVREGDKVHEVPAGHPFLREVARRNGVIRYAWTGGLTDPDQYWSKVDPSWQLIMTRTRGVPSNDRDRAIKANIKELLKTATPLGPLTRAYLDAFCVELDPDPKHAEHEQDRALALCIDSHLRWLVELLRDAGFKDAKTQAAEYVAGHWRKSVQQDRGRWRFSSGPALAAWLRRHRDSTKNTPKMSCQRGPSEHSDEG
jgi:hypothetical protein